MSSPVLRRGRPALHALHPLALAAALVLHGVVTAAPEGGRPTFGQTQISRPDANTTRIDQSTARAGIDWQGFSIGAAETVRVVQPDANAVLVNRVTSLEPSLILGRLQANGRVFLTNPRGVIFGQGAQVDVGGLVATTLSLGDADAQAGRWWLQDSGQAGAVRNAGRLSAAGGTVVLLAPQVQNSGSIDARRVALGAVSAARVDLDGDGLILFDTRAADAARLDQLGRIAADGGRAELIAQARGQAAGTVLNLRGAVFARGLGTQGGDIVIDGGTSGIVEIGSRVDASAAHGSGGRITALGDRVLLDHGAQLDAGGARSGGSIHVGGGFQGRDPALHNASMVVVQSGAVLDASATQAGDGGRVVVWSLDATRFAGRADARGGASGGDGGLVEVSGKQQLDFTGTSDRSAARGRAGTLLLDPVNLTIQAAAPDIADNNSGGDLTSPSLLFAAAGTNSRITSGALQTQLAAGSVTLQAADTITVASAVNSGSASSLTLQAGNNIAVNAPVGVGGNLVLSAGDAGATAPQAGAVSVNAPLTAGGTLTLNNGSRGGTHQLGADLNAATLVLNGNAALTAPVTLNLSGPTTLTSTLTGTAALIKAGAGTLALGSGGALPGGTLVVSSGTLDLGGGGTSVAGLTQTGGRIVNGTLVSASAFDLQAGESSATMAGSVGVNKSSSGTYRLAGTNTYSGITNVIGGTLVAANNAALGAVASPTVVASGAALELSGSVSTGSELLTLSGNGAGNSGALVVSGSNSVDNIVLDGDASIGGSGSLAVQVAISDTTAPALFTKLGSGRLTLNGLAQHRGGTRVEAGTLALGAADRLPDADTVSVAGGTFALAGFTDTVGGVVLEGGSITGPGTLASTTIFDLRAGSVTAALAGTVGVVKSGSGTVTLAGANTYGGSTSITGGTLALGADDVLPDSSIVQLNGASATLNVGSFSDTIAGLTLVDGTVNGSGSLSSSGSYALQQGQVHAVLGGSASLTKTSSGFVTLTAANTYSGATVVQQGPLILRGAGKPGSTAAGSTVNSTGTLWLDNADIGIEGLTMAGGVLRGSNTARAEGLVALGSDTTIHVDSGTLTLGGVISGASRDVTKIGTGTLALQADNTYTGTTAVQDGTLELGSAERLSNSSALTIGSAGTVALNGNERVASLTMNGGTLDGSGSALSTGNLQYTLGGSATVNANLGLGTLNVSGNATLNGTASTANVNLSGGTLTLGASDRLAADVSVATAIGTKLALLGNQTVASITGTGEVDTGSNGIFTVDVLNAGTVTFAGRVTGDGNLEKSGSGDLGLSGVSSYRGSTNVNAGTLRLLSGDDRLPTSTDLVVANGARLDLNNRSQQLNSFTGGSVDGPGRLRAGSFTLVSGGLGAGIDLGNVPITVSGAYTLGSSTDASQVRVESGGELTLNISGIFSSAAEIVVAGTLTLAGNESVRSLSLSGLLDGVGSTLSAAGGYVLDQGARVQANLGTGTLTVQGNAELSGTAAATAVNLQNGATLTTTVSNRLSSNAALTLQGGSTLALGNRSESVASLDLDSGSIPSGTLNAAGFAVKDGSIGATLGGSGNLTKTGTGTVLLSGSNNYIGGTSVQEGTLALQSGGLLGNNNSGTVVGPFGTLELRATGSGAGENITLNGGQLLATGGTSTVPSTATLTLNAGSVLEIAQNSNLRLDTSPSGSALTKTGDGSLTLNAAASSGSYGGSTQVSGGTLALGISGALPTGTTVQISNGATLALGNASNTIAGLTLFDGNVSTSGGQLSSSGVYDLHSGSVDAALAGSAAVSKSDSGTVTLSRANSYGGPTTVSGGTLRLTSAGNLGNATGTTTVADGATLHLDGVGSGNEALSLAGSGVDGLGALRASGGTLITAGGPLTLAQTATLRVDSLNDTLALSSSPQGTASVGLTKTGAGTLRLDAAAGSSSYGGATTVSNGTLLLGVANALPDSSPVTINGGATLNPDGNSDTVASLLLDNGTLGAGTLAASGGFELRSGSVQSVLAGNGGLLKSRSGIVTLTARATYDGATTVTGGTLHLTTANALPVTTALTINGSDASLDIGSNNTAVRNVQLGLGSITGTTGTLSASNEFDLQQGSVSAKLGGDAALRKTGIGTVVLSGINSYTGATTVSEGTLQSGADNVLPDSNTVTVGSAGTLDLLSFSDSVMKLVLDGGSVLGTTGLLSGGRNFDLRSGTVSARLGGAFGIDKTTIGTVNLAGANSYAGTTTATAGTLNVQHAQALGSAIGAGAGTVVSSGATLALAGVDIGNEALSLAGSGVGASGALQATGTARAGGSVTMSGDVSVGVGGNAGQLTLAGAIGGNGGFTKRGAGKLVLAGSGNYAGATTVSGGTLALAAAERLPDNTALQVTSGASVLLNGNERVGSLTLGGLLGGTGTLTADSYTLQRDADVSANLGAGTLNISGNTRLSGTSQAQIVNVLAETLTLATANRLLDSAIVTVVNGAELALNGNEIVGTLNLAGGTLLGTGTLTAATTTITGGTTSADTAGTTLTSSGGSKLNGRAAFTSVNVADGVLTLGAAGRLATSPAVAVAVASDAALKLGGDETFGLLSGAGNVDLGAVTLSTGSGGNSLFSGSLLGTGSLVKQGGSNFTLAGSNAYTGSTRIDAGTLTVAGTLASSAINVEAGMLVLAAADLLADTAAVNVLSGASFVLNGDDRIRSLVLAGNLNGSGTLTANTYALNGGTARANLGAGVLTSTGNSRLDGTAAASGVGVAAGTLTLGAADRLADDAVVTVAGGRAGLVLNGNDTIGSLALSGLLSGAGRLTAAAYALDGGTADADLGAGALQSRGTSTVNGSAGANSILVTGGRLAVTRSGALTAAPQLDVQAGTLQLAGTQTVGAVTSAGSLETGSALNASSVNSDGSVLLGGSITTSGNQRYAGAVQAAPANTAPALTAGDQAQITALNAANDFGSGALSLRAGSVQLHDAGALALGDVRLGSGASAIDAAGVLRLQGALALNDGQLVLASAAPAVAGGAALRNNVGNEVFLPDPLDGAASRTQLVAAAAVIVQDAAATLDTTAASTLRLRASGGGSIDLGGSANRIDGGISAVSGSTASYDIRAAQGSGRLSLVAIRADTLKLVADDSSGDAVRGDVVTLAARRLSTAPGSAIRARLPYSVKQGAGSQLPALNFEISGNSSGFGSVGAPVHISIGNVEAATGIGGLYLTTLPAPVAGQPNQAALYLDCGGCAVAPFYQYAGNPDAVLGFVGGRLLAEAPPPASAITSNTALLEEARRNLFEAAVRTENVRGRLRAGVIAEVGKGRPATQGTGGARRPQTCDVAAAGLDCAPASR